MVKKSLILKQIIFVTLFSLVLMCSSFVLLDYQTFAEDRWSQVPKANRQSGEEVKQEKSAQQKLALIEYIVIENPLKEYYDNVRRYIGVKFGGLYHTLLSEVLSDKNAAVRFTAKLAAHDIGLKSKYWRVLEDRLEGKYYRATKGRYSYIDARKKIDKVIEYIGIEEYETDEKKIRKILNVVKGFVHYENDFNEVAMTPLETLNSRSGDCEDFSILVAALFKRVGINSAIASFKSKDGGPGHAMVLFQSSESVPFYYYNDLTQFGLERGRWYLIEPQKRFNEQNDPANNYIIESAASISQVSQK